MGLCLGARILSPAEATPDALSDAQRIGFGSGIYWLGFDPALADCIRGLTNMSGKDAFVFATSGLPEPPFRRYTRTLGRDLTDTGFRVVDTFLCRGIDTWGPFKVVGGVNKSRPDDNDLAAARDFATGLTA